MRWTDILATEKAKGRKINWSVVRVVSQKGALVELSEVAVKSDAKNNESRNEAKGGLQGDLFEKGSQGVRAKTKTKAKAFNNKMGEEEKLERLGACGRVEPRRYRSSHEIGRSKQV
jgi:hypothetical protein